MKSILFIVSFMFFLLGCNDQRLSHRETVITYYKARDAVNYNKIKTHISDRLILTEGKYVMSYTPDSFYEVFKWDSIFRPSYEIVELEEKNNQVIVSIALNSIRNEFLINSSMTCQYRISFDAGKISKIESLDCVGVDWKLWEEEKDALVNWILIHHPELDGFIHDMTMNGAMKYLKAIELYKKGLN